LDTNLAAVFSLDLFSDPTAVAQILSLNEKTQQFGLVLTPTDASALVQTRTEVLNANGRIEVGSATIGKLVDAFCDSAYINQREYLPIMHALIEIFYDAKNETLDLISDDELIEFMKTSFEYNCGGSLDLLAGRDLNKLAQNLRFGVKNYWNMNPDEDKLDEDEWDDDSWSDEEDYEKEGNHGK
jgi:hypothetical protein